MGQSFHMTVSLAGGLRMSDRELRGMLKQGDHELTPEECRTLFIQKLREGFDVLPMCDHHDEKGHCLGHEEQAPDAQAQQPEAAIEGPPEQIGTGLYRMADGEVIGGERDDDRYL